MFFDTEKHKIVIIVILSILLLILAIGGYFGYRFWNASKVADLADSGLMYIQQGDYEKAETVLNQALEKVNSKDKISKSRIYKNLAMLYENTDRIEKTVENYMKAKSLFNENEPDYYVFSGQINLLERDLNMAVENFNKALDIDPDNFDAHNTLGLLYLGQLILGVEPDYKLALIHNKRAFELQRGTTTMQNLALNYYLMGDYDDALPLFVELDSLIKDDATTKFFIGLIYFKQKDYIIAKIFLSKAIEIDPVLKTREAVAILKELDIALKEFNDNMAESKK
jgi:tetratricopeptide (TPR) repeat protein